MVTNPETGARLQVTVTRRGGTVTVATDGADIRVHLAGGDIVATTGGAAVLPA